MIDGKTLGLLPSSQDLDFFLSMFLFGSVFALPPWIIAGWIRLYHLGRCYQLNRSSSKYYLHWLLEDRTERRDLLFSSSLVILEFVIVELLLKSGDGLLLFLTSFVNGGLAIAVLIISPPNKRLKHKGVLTWHIVCLVGLACVLEALPLILIVAGINALNIWRGTETVEAIVQALFFAGPIGVIAFCLTPLLIPIVNVLLWPIEKILLQHTLSSN